MVDNESTDGSAELVSQRWPGVRVVREQNRGLASFNRVLTALDEPVVLLLNNDVKLAPSAVAPLLRVFEDHDDALFSAPLCWSFDGREYEGMRTRVRSRFGLVQGMCRVPGHERVLDRADLTASAGPVLAVDRRKFLALGGYDPVYFPGRIEDLDLGFRGWMAGLKGYYEPRSVAYHRGFGTLRARNGNRSLRRAGDPQQLPVRVEEPEGIPAGRTPLLGARAAGILAAAWADRSGCQPGCRGAAVCRGRPGVAADERSARGPGSRGRKRSFAGFHGSKRPCGAALRRSRSRRPLLLRVRNPQGGDPCLRRLSTW